MRSAFYSRLSGLAVVVVFRIAASLTAFPFIPVVVALPWAGIYSIPRGVRRRFL